jgi:hypothetical protein
MHEMEDAGYTEKEAEEEWKDRKSRKSERDTDWED